MSSLHELVFLSLMLSADCRGNSAVGSKEPWCADFSKDPVATGWMYESPADQPGTGQWLQAGPDLDRACISAGNGKWTGPALPVTPYDFYELRFTVKGTGHDGYWVINFFTADGTLLVSDHYLSYDPAADWQENVFCFRARPGAATIKLSLHPETKGWMAVSAVAIRPISRRDTAGWLDSMSATIPPVSYSPPAGRWTFLPNTLAALKGGKTLSVVMLGDSIINDTGNSNFEALIERRYPGCRINLHTAVRGGGACGYYKEENRIQEYVLAFHPDLVIIGGISSPDAEAVRSVVRQLRAKTQAEILLQTGCFGRNPLALTPQWQARVTPDGPDYRSQLGRVAREEKTGFMDLEGAWGEYLRACGRPADYFMRDPVHANARGECLVAKLSDAFFCD